MLDGERDVIRQVTDHGHLNVGSTELAKLQLYNYPLDIVGTEEIVKQLLDINAHIGIAFGLGHLMVWFQSYH